MGRNAREVWVASRVLDGRKRKKHISFVFYTAPPNFDRKITKMFRKACRDFDLNKNKRVFLVP